MVLGVLTGWLDRREREAIAYLIEENRLLRRQLGTRRLRLTDDDRRRLAARAFRVGRAALREIATIATPDTLLRWHRRLIARKSNVLSATRPAQRPPRDPALGRADGGGESDVGLHSDPRRVEERGASRGAVDDPAHHEGGRRSARTPAADLMADVLERALGQHRWGRFLHDRSLDLPRSSSRTTPFSSLIWRPAACRSSDRRRIRSRY